MLYDDHIVHNELITEESSLIDVFIGKKIKNRRTILGITQKDLGKIVGVSAQQIQKYETASNRVACSTLYVLSKHLKIPVDYFFDANTHHHSLSVQEDQENFGEEEIHEKEIIKLINFYKSIKDQILRKRIYQLIESLSDKTNKEIEV